MRIKEKIKEEKGRLSILVLATVLESKKYVLQFLKGKRKDLLSFNKDKYNSKYRNGK